MEKIGFITLVFYAVIALENDFTTSIHKQLIGWFNLNYIKSAVFLIKYGQIFKNAFDKRQESDYDDYVSFELEEVMSDYLDMLEFINLIKNNLSEK